ncbi:MAG: hypothetical protein Q7J70_06570 [Thermodesulfovibrionales bacterium]|nr:hypothetical protein [Thermodesulfovibrionales bacterium]
MKTSLVVNNNSLPFKDLTQNYIASVLCAIAHSLGDDSRNVTTRSEPEDFHAYTDSGELNIKKGFTMMLIESTIKDLLSPLKGVFWSQNIAIAVNGKKNA